MCRSARSRFAQMQLGCFNFSLMETQRQNGFFFIWEWWSETTTTAAAAATKKQTHNFSVSLGIVRWCFLVFFFLFIFHLWLVSAGVHLIHFKLLLLLLLLSSYFGLIFYNTRPLLFAFVALASIQTNTFTAKLNSAQLVRNCCLQNRPHRFPEKPHEKQKARQINSKKRNLYSTKKTLAHTHTIKINKLTSSQPKFEYRFAFLAYSIGCGLFCDCLF